MQGVLAQLTWSHHQLLLDKVKNLNKQLFYMHKCVENDRNSDVLEKQIA